MRGALELVRCGNIMAAGVAQNFEPIYTMEMNNQSESSIRLGQNNSNDDKNDKNESEKSPNQRREMMLKAVVNNFTKGTTAHGLNRANNDQSWVRMVWVAIVIAAMTGAIIHTTKQVKTYLLYPVSSTNRQEPNSFEFPDLTLCDPLNKRFFHQEMFHLAQSVNQTLYVYMAYSLIYSHFGGENEWQKERRAIEMFYTALEHMLNVTSVNIRPKDMIIYCMFDGVPCDHTNFEVFYHRQYTNCFTFKAKNRVLSSSGMDRGLFLLVYVPSSDIKVRLDSLSRLASGLENNGLRFQIHQRDTIPHPLEYGIMAPTGTLTAVALEQVKTSLANTPTHPCILDKKLTLYDNQFDYMKSYDRQLFDCIKHEYHKEINETCGCLMESHLISDPSFSTSELEKMNFCHDITNLYKNESYQTTRKAYQKAEQEEQAASRNVTALQKYISIGIRMRQLYNELNKNIDKMMCADNVSENIVKPERCYDSCNYNKYEYSLSQCPWPEDSFEVRNSQIQMVKIAGLLESYMKQHMSASAPGEPLPALITSLNQRTVNMSDCQTYDTQNFTVPNRTACNQIQLFVRRSIVQLRIYPATLTVRHTIEERSYELVNLCSDLGGILGLWIGFSIVTIFEFAEFFILCGSYYWYAMLSKLPKRKSVPLVIPQTKTSSMNNRRYQTTLTPNKYFPTSATNSNAFDSHSTSPTRSPFTGLRLANHDSRNNHDAEIVPLHGKNEIASYRLLQQV